MGASRTLLRNLDLDLIARIEASGRPEQPKPAATKRTPRPGVTYRRNGRAFAFAPWAPPVDVQHRPYRASIALNRASRWTRARSYAHAREMSPSAEPVR